MEQNFCQIHVEFQKSSSSLNVIENFSHSEFFIRMQSRQVKLTEHYARPPPRRVMMSAECLD